MGCAGSSSTESMGGMMKMGKGMGMGMMQKGMGMGMMMM